MLDADAMARTRVESGHTRALTTVFGEVSVSRMAYRAPGRANLHPADAELNLPAEKHSHGLRQLAAIEAARGSFDDTVAAIDRHTGVRLGKRQVEQLAVAAAADFDDFYAQRTPPQPGAADYVLAIYRNRFEDEAILSVTGRDIMEAEYALVARDGILWCLDGENLAEARDTVAKRQPKTTWPTA